MEHRCGIRWHACSLQRLQGTSYGASALTRTYHSCRGWALSVPAQRVRVYFSACVRVARNRLVSEGYSMHLCWQAFLWNLNRCFSDCWETDTMLLKPELSRPSLAIHSPVSFFCWSLIIRRHCGPVVRPTGLSLDLFCTSLPHYCPLPCPIVFTFLISPFCVITYTISPLFCFQSLHFFKYSIICITGGSGWKHVTSYGWKEMKSWCHGRARPIYLSGSWCCVTWGNNAPGCHRYSFTSARNGLDKGVLHLYLCIFQIQWEPRSFHCPGDFFQPSFHFCITKVQQFTQFVALGTESIKWSATCPV